MPTGIFIRKASSTDFPDNPTDWLSLTVPKEERTKILAAGHFHPNYGLVGVGGFYPTPKEIAKRHNCIVGLGNNHPPPWWTPAYKPNRYVVFEEDERTEDKDDLIFHYLVASPSGNLSRRLSEWQFISSPLRVAILCTQPGSHPVKHLLQSKVHTVVFIGNSLNRTCPFTQKSKTLMPLVDNRVTQSPWMLGCLWPTLLGILGAATGAFLFPLILLMRMDFANGDETIFSIGFGLGSAVAGGAIGGFVCGFGGWFIGWTIVGWRIRRRSRKKYSKL